MVKKSRLLLTALIVFVMSFMLMGFDSQQQKIYDDANLLTTEQETKLQEACVTTAENTKVDVIIATTNNNSKSAMKYAEDFYMSHSFGYDKLHGDGVLMLIDMDNREVYVATSGLTVDYLSDTRIDKMSTDIASYLGSANYNKACETFISELTTYMQSKPTSSDVAGDGTTKYTADYDKEASIPRMLLLNALIAAGCAAAIVVIMMFNAKAKMAVGSHTYLKNHDCNFRDKRDLFINTTVVKQKIETNNNSHGGGGSTHIGSGGHSFGGGGHKF